MLSIGLWVAAALTIVTTLLRNLLWERASLLFGLLTLEGALGIATLQPATRSSYRSSTKHAPSPWTAALVPRDLGRTTRADIKLGVYVSTA